MVFHSSRKLFQIGCLISLLLSSASTLDAATVSDVVTRLGGRNAQHKREGLVKGAQAEGELVFYGTILVNEFSALGKVFNARYPFINLKHYFAPRQDVLNRSLNEARAGAHLADLIQVDSSYGYQLMNENLVHPYPAPNQERFFDGTYEPDGSWHSMYYLTTALVYNTTQLKPDEAPQSYEDLLNPKWKGKLVFDPEAAYILAAMESAWGKAKAVEYLRKLSQQDLNYRRGGALTTQVVSSGEFPVGIAINGETSAGMRSKGAPLGFKLLSPKIVKPEGLFLMKHSRHPHAALLFAEWVLSEEAQSFLAGELGKGVALKGVKSKHQEFQVQPDYVVSPRLGPKLNAYLQEFRTIMGIK
ncbi:MAG TPA: extracellular solute-binding protein [Candidatus Binatia bacterium]|nr:extracellular solute-binding protein [Candidatus Binatia bacterium]